MGSTTAFAGIERIWKGAKNARASVASNWEPEGVPMSGDSIVLDSSCVNNFIWDVNVELASWTQDGYTGTVTFETVYDPAGFAYLDVTGDVTLTSGKWTHLANTGENRKYRLYAQIGGNLTVGPQAQISAIALGYTSVRNTETGAALSPPNCGGTHGGYGDYLQDEAKWMSLIRPYGSVCAPEELGGRGSSSSGVGGGAIRLDVKGAFQLDGLLCANTATNAYYNGAGGSVYVRAGTISGSGTITADSISTDSGGAAGAGGRIAVVLTEPNADFSSFDPVMQCSARSIATQKTEFGGPGTVYAETPADKPNEGWLIIRGTGKTPKNVRAYGASLHDAAAGTTSFAFSRITVTNRAFVVVESGCTLDMSNTVFQTDFAGVNTNGIALAGGRWIPQADGIVSNFHVRALSGTVESKSVTFAPGSQLIVEESAEGLVVSNDLVFESGALGMINRPLTVAGDLTLRGRLSRTGPFDPPVPLTLNVDGDMLVAATGCVDLNNVGYKTKPSDQTISGVCSSHGGHGGNSGGDNGPNKQFPYGSILEPLTGGSKGDSCYGGGILSLTVAGRLTNNGIIQASSKKVSYYPASGGSLNIRAGSLYGSGVISANGGSANSDSLAMSGGGRAAIRLTGVGEDFSHYTGVISAFGARCLTSKTSYVGGAGTVWLRTADQDETEGTLLVRNELDTLKKWLETPVGGVYMAAGDDTFGDVIVGSCAKLQVESGCTLHVSGVLSNGCNFVACADSAVEFVGTGTSRLYGDFTFVDLMCKTAGKTIEVEPGRILTVTGVGAFAGTADAPVTIRGNDGWTLAHDGTVTMEGVSLGNCTSTSPLTVINGADLGGNSDNVKFITVTPGQTLTWTGATDGDWAKGTNWDAERAPIATDKVVIPAGLAIYPTIAADISVAELSVAEGASLTIDSKTLTVTGDLTAAGAVSAVGAATVAVRGNFTLAGPFERGLSTVRIEGTEAQTLTLGAAVLNRLELAAPAVSVVGNLAAEELVIGDGTKTFACTFQDGATVSVTALTVLGDAATTSGALSCSAANGQWKLVTYQATVIGTAVSGSDASGSVAIVPQDCRDDGDNVNWLFVDNRTHWNGTAWSDGEPTLERDAVIDTGATLVVNDDFEVRNLTVSSNAVMRINATLTAAGSVVVEPSGKLECNRPGTIGGNLNLLPGATLSHATNAKTEANKIDLAVAGSGYVAATASVNVKGCGYNDLNSGPSPTKVSGRGAAHGGQGWSTSANPAPVSYGSAMCPTNLGSCGSYYSVNLGGGAVKLVFGGALRLDGEINADASGDSNYTGSGGSIWITATELRGSGSAHAEGPHDTGNLAGGAGGRVAVYLTQATDLSAFAAGELQAYGGGNKSVTSTQTTIYNPGTVYVQTAADAPGGGTLTVANRKGSGKTVAATDTTRSTDLKAAICSEPDVTRDWNVVVKDYGVLTLNADATIRDIHVLDKTSLLKLNGHTLRIRSFRHEISPDDTKYVVLGDGGQIIWRERGLSVIIR